MFRATPRRWCVISSGSAPLIRSSSFPYWTYSHRLSTLRFLLSCTGAGMQGQTPSGKASLEPNWNRIRFSGPLPLGVRLFKKQSPTIHGRLWIGNRRGEFYKFFSHPVPLRVC